MNGTPFVVFDVDDTLVDTFRTSVVKCALTAEQLGLRAPSAAHIAARYGKADFRSCVRAWHPDVDLDSYQSVYDSLATRVPAEPLCHFSDLVAAARTAGFAVGVLTNGPGHKTERKLTAVGVSPEDLDFVEHAGTNPVPKPAPAAFSRLAALHGLDPRRSWYVSDSPSDWAGANAAGLRSIAVPRDPAFGAAQTFADLTVPDATSLTGLFDVCARTSAPRPPSAPTAWSVDAGFTLVEHRLTPSDLLLEACAVHEVHATRNQVAAALEGPRALLGDTARVWSSDMSAETALLGYYRAVLARLGAPESEAPAVLRRYTEPSNWVARDGAAELVRSLNASGRPVGVLANWQSNVEDVLDKAGLAGAFDQVLPSTALGAGKPSPRAFRALADALGATVQEVIHIGDDPITDVGGALAAGARAVWLPSNLSKEELCRTMALVV